MTNASATAANPCPACGGPMTPCQVVLQWPGAVDYTTAPAWQCDACNGLALPGARVMWMRYEPVLRLTGGTNAER